MHNIYYTTKLDVIIQCELVREPGGQTSLPDNNLVLVSVNKAFYLGFSDFMPTIPDNNLVLVSVNVAAYAWTT